MAGGQLVVGMFCCVGAAFLLALAMSIQQYALSCPDDAPIMRRCNRNSLWLFGLFVYLVAQLSFVAAIGMGPFAVMSALFTSVLVFDYGIAYVTRGKKPSKHEASGLAIISVAVALCSVFSPKETYDVTPAYLAAWIKSFGGIFTIILLAFVLGMGMYTIHQFEKSYPEFPARGTKTSGKQPSSKRVEIMRIIYPGVLATFETLGAASLKAVTSMVAIAVAKEDMDGNVIEGVESAAAFYVAISIWCCCIAGTVIWLRKVYEKFKTTECLPTEIGLTTVFSILVALMFYQEHSYASSADLGMLSFSGCMIMVGIYVMTLHAEVDSGPSNASDHIRRYPVNLFPAKKVWHRSINKVIIANSLGHHHGHGAMAAMTSVVVQDMETRPPNPTQTHAFDASSGEPPPPLNNRRKTSVVERATATLMRAPVGHFADAQTEHGELEDFEILG